jgi:hypothetical protein
MPQRGPVPFGSKPETLLEEEPKKPQAGRPLGATELATKLVAERLKLAKQNDEGKTENERFESKSNQIKGKKRHELGFPDSDKSVERVKVIRPMSPDKLAVERRPERIRQGEWETRPVRKQRQSNARLVTHGKGS